MAAYGPGAPGQAEKAAVAVSTAVIVAGNVRRGKALSVAARSGEAVMAGGVDSDSTAFDGAGCVL
jgi:hypothetical protein